MLMMLIIHLGKRRYNIKLWKVFTDCFNCLPIAAIIDEKIFCMHGGLSPDLKTMEQIRRVVRPTDVPDTGTSSCQHISFTAHLHLILTTFIKDCFATCYGPIPTRIFKDGGRMTVECLSLLDMTSLINS